MSNRKHKFLTFSFDGSIQDVFRITHLVMSELSRFGCFEPGVTTNLEMILQDNGKDEK